MLLSVVYPLYVITNTVPSYLYFNITYCYPHPTHANYTHDIFLSKVYWMVGEGGKDKRCLPSALVWRPGRSVFSLVPLALVSTLCSREKTNVEEGGWCGHKQ